MSADGRRRALSELDRARPALRRMDTAGAPAETAGDLLDVWNAVQAALQALIDNPGLTGQTLIREARARQLIVFEQANALAELDAVRDRAERNGYRPTEADMRAARTAYDKLESALRLETPPFGAPIPQSPAGAIPYAPPPATSPAPVQAPVLDPVSPGLQPLPRPRRRWLLPVIAGIVALIALGVGGYLVFAHGSTDAKSLDDGIRFYGQGQREAAEGAFTTAVRQDPKDPRPHVYLARMAREAGNLTLANQELQLALQADPANAIARREMGSYLLAAGNNELAVKFYVHALESDSTDKAAMGWLGCALTRLNRLPEAQRWLTRAGSGDWSKCSAPPVTPARGSIPRQP